MLNSSMNKESDTKTWKKCRANIIQCSASFILMSACALKASAFQTKKTQKQFSTKSVSPLCSTKNNPTNNQQTKKTKQKQTKNNPKIQKTSFASETASLQHFFCFFFEAATQCFESTWFFFFSIVAATYKKVSDRCRR